MGQLDHVKRTGDAGTRDSQLMANLFHGGYSNDSPIEGAKGKLQQKEKDANQDLIDKGSIPDLQLSIGDTTEKSNLSGQGGGAPGDKPNQGEKPEQPGEKPGEESAEKHNHMKEKQDEKREELKEEKKEENPDKVRKSIKE